MNNKLIITIVAVALFVLPALSQNIIHTVGILPFANNSIAERDAMEPLSKGLAEMMTTELAKINSLKVIERADLAKIIDELKLSMSGVISEESAKQAGKMLGADVLLLGSYMHGFDGEIRIDTRLVRVETGETIKAGEVTGKAKKVFAMVTKLSFKLAENLNIGLSKDEMNSLKTTDNESFDALIYFSKGLDAEDKSDFSGAMAMYELALKANPEYGQARKRMELLAKKK